RASCQQTLNISLFFDGTNNNDDKDNVKWRDSQTKCQTNVERLYNVALDDDTKGIYRYYIPGVGTPFPKIGEFTYSEGGKAFAAGFNQRCVWAYTRVLNAAYRSIRKDTDWLLIPDDDARMLSNAGAYSNKQDFKQRFEPYLTRLKAAHAQAVKRGSWS